jgi:FMN phosphatase YigB (HAD superfamily)
MPDSPKLTIVLDAMGVLYESGDDVAELLVPFVLQKKPNFPVPNIEAAYLAASLGEITAKDFWTAVGLSEALEEEYLQHHRVKSGVRNFLSWAASRKINVACLSNDVGRWSISLRKRFSLEEWITPWVISSEVRVRKPDLAVYKALIDRLACRPHEILFVDDREKNILAANSLGIHGVLLNQATAITESDFPVFSNFLTLQEYCEERLAV